MGTVRIVDEALKQARDAARNQVPTVGPRHLAEATARGLGHHTQAALVAAIRQTPLFSFKAEWDAAAFEARLAELSPGLGAADVTQACAVLGGSLAIWGRFAVCLAKSVIRHVHEAGGGQVQFHTRPADETPGFSRVVFRTGNSAPCPWPVSSSEAPMLERALTYGFRLLVDYAPRRLASRTVVVLQPQSVGLGELQGNVRVFLGPTAKGPFLVAVPAPLKLDQQLGGLELSGEARGVVLSHANSKPGVRVVSGPPGCGKASLSRAAYLETSKRAHRQEVVPLDLSWWPMTSNVIYDAGAMQALRAEAVAAVRRAAGRAVVLMPTLCDGLRADLVAALVHEGAAVWLPVDASGEAEALERAVWLGVPRHVIMACMHVDDTPVASMAATPAGQTALPDPLSRGN